MRKLVHHVVTFGLLIAGTAAAHAAQSAIAISPNPVYLGSTTVVRYADENVASNAAITVQRFEAPVGRAVAVDGGGQSWTNVASQFGSPVKLSSLDYGLGRFGVRLIAVVGYETNVSPALNMTVAPYCGNGVRVTVVRAFGRGIVAAGSQGSWSATYRVTACEAVSNLSISFGRISGPALVNASFYPAAKSRSAVGDLAAGASYEFTVTTAGTLPALPSGTMVNTMRDLIVSYRGAKQTTVTEPVAVQVK